MRTLIVATSRKPRHAEHEIELGQRPHIDYLDLSSYLSAPYIDYDTLGIRPGAVRWFEERLRMDIYLATRVARMVREQRYDTVLSLSERVGIPLSYLLSRKVRHVVVMHHPMSPQKLRLLKMLQIPRRWDLLIALSQAEADALDTLFHLGPDRIKVLHTPLDIAFYKPLDEAGLASEPPHALSIGLAQRDYPTLIHAMRGLPNVTCQISATSAWASHKAGYEDEIIPENVKIASYDHPSIIRERYTMSRFTIIPIRRQTTQWSAGSTSLLQPQAMGRPVIATRMPGLADYVLDGETGLLVEGGNPAAMAAAIQELWSNPDRAAAMGRRGREWVAAHFSLERWLRDVGSTLASLGARQAVSAT
jgi:glycosyltransferase involved in cell wall biosynthesis